MKALILAGGRGKRLNQLSEQQNKCMIGINGKPTIEYSLECASETSVTEIVIVVGYKAEEVINTYGNNYNGKSIKYVIQHEQNGLVHAVECSRETLGQEDFMLMLGDELLIGSRRQEMINIFEEEDLFGVCGVVEVEDKSLISKTYSIICSEDNRIYRLIEKPRKPMNNIMGTGNCIFKNEILSYLDQTPINQKRGEKELPDLIQCAIDEANIVKSFLICDKYFNINSDTELKAMNSYFSHL